MSCLSFSALTKQTDLQGIPVPELGMECEANSAWEWVSHEVWELAILKRQLAEARLGRHLKHSSDHSEMGRHPGEVGRTRSMELLGQSSEVWDGRKTKQRELR